MPKASQDTFRQMLEIVNKVDEEIESDLDLFELKNEICNQFQKFRDSFDAYIQKEEIALMAKIEELSKQFRSNFKVQLIKQSIKEVKDYISLVQDNNKQQKFSFPNGNGKCKLGEKFPSEKEVESLERMCDDIIVMQSDISDIIFKLDQKANDIKQNCSFLLENLFISIKKEIDSQDLINIISFNNSDYLNNSFKMGLDNEVIVQEEIYSTCRVNQDSLATVSKNNYLKIYDMKEDCMCTCKSIIPLPSKTVIQQSSNILAIGSQEGFIFIYQYNPITKSASLLQTIIQSISIWDICKVSNRVLACASFCGRIRLINYRQSKTLQEYHDEKCSFVAIKASGSQHLIVASSHILILNAHTLKIEQGYEDNDMGYIFALEVLDNKRIVFGGTDCKIRIYNHFTRLLEKVLIGHRSTLYSIKMISPWIFVSSSDDGQLSVWDINNQNPCKQQKNIHINSSFSFEIMPKYNRLITAGKDQSLKIWK